MENDVEEILQDCEAEEETTVETECTEISVQTMDGIISFQTMRVTGHHSKKDLQILLDSGSIHNFIGASKALILDCKVEIIQPI